MSKAFAVSGPVLLVVSYAATNARHLLVDKLANRPHVLA